MEIFELKDKIITVEETLKNLEGLLDIEHLKETIKKIEAKTYEANFWDNHESANQTIEHLKLHKNKLTQYENLMEMMENLKISLELLEMDVEVETLEADVKKFDKTLEQFETNLYLSEPYDLFNAIIEIHPGAGGTESQDWAMMLYRMLKRYTEEKNYHFELNDYQDGQEAGLKSTTFTISGMNAYGYLKAEQGVHRLVRLSPFDSSGRRHTSFASINVIPELDDSIDVEINETDLKIDTYRSSGAGGQSVNTTDSAVRITHLPTKLTVTCQNERSQIKNREKALKMLKGKLYQLKLEEQELAASSFKSTLSNAFGSQIRSYVMHPYSMVKDHRTGEETGNVQKVLDGDIDRFIYAYLKLLAKGE
ncbi:peptide chain release factor 2 [Liberiplasma polymorphum]|uniref:peptide chain release factor 2 n=1 Tax=Liberiplasma polymorphum TaxID=3374570 RepID=UPI003774DED8